jgi:predicted nucleotidyltransferase
MLSQVPMTIEAYAGLRDLLVDRIVTALTADPRVTAAWLSGSVGRRVDDASSDLDLHVAVDDDAFLVFLAERDRLYRQTGEPLLVQPDRPSNAQAGARFQLVVYRGPIEVDWNIGLASQAARPPETELLFARRDVPIALPPSLSDAERLAKATDFILFFGATAPMAIKHAARGESRRASNLIDQLTGLFMVLWRVVVLPDDPDPSAAHGQNRATEAELDALLPRLGWDFDPFRALAVVRDLCAEAERLHAALAAMGVPIPAAMPRETAVSRPRRGDAPPRSTGRPTTIPLDATTLIVWKACRTNEG